MLENHGAAGNVFDGMRLAKQRADVGTGGGQVSHSELSRTSAVRNEFKETKKKRKLKITILNANAIQKQHGQSSKQ